ncbi:MAG: hypothetical protein ACYDD0_01360 [Candidatus Dormibacteria bacterium]
MNHLRSATPLRIGRRDPLERLVGAVELFMLDHHVHPALARRLA